MKTSMKTSQPSPKELMARSEAKKKMAYEQERLGKEQIKNKVKLGQTGTSKYKETLGQPLPVGAERLKIAKDMRLSSKLDSLQSVRMNKKQDLDDKIKIAEKLYKSNPTKSFRDGVERAKSQRLDANKIKKK